MSRGKVRGMGAATGAGDGALRAAITGTVANSSAGTPGLLGVAGRSLHSGVGARSPGATAPP